MRRIKEHPVLEIPREREKVTIFVGEQKISALKGETVAAALIASGIRVFRKTPKLHRSRGIFCGIGRCTDCALTIDGVPNVRSCVTEVQDGMQIEVQDGLGEWIRS